MVDHRHQLGLIPSGQQHDETSQSSTPTIQRSLDYDGPLQGEHSEKGERTLPENNGHEGFFAKTEEMAEARKTYFKSFIGGAFLVMVTIFAVFPIYWGSLWKIPAHPLNGWFVVRFLSSTS